MQAVIKNCVSSIMKDIKHKATEEHNAYQKRGYARQMKMKPMDYYYLRLDQIKGELRGRLRRLRLADDWIEEFIAKNFKVTRKNSRGHSGVHTNRC